MRFAGIDIGSRTHELAVVDEQSAVLVKPTPIIEDAGGYERLFRLLGSAADVLVVLEATGHYWRNLFAALCTRGFRVAVVNPLRIRRFSQEDPIGNRAAARGAEAYAYVENAPVFLVDPLGLTPSRPIPVPFPTPGGNCVSYTSIGGKSIFKIAIGPWSDWGPLGSASSGGSGFEGGLPGSASGASPDAFGGGRNYNPGGSGGGWGGNPFWQAEVCIWRRSRDIHRFWKQPFATETRCKCPPSVSTSMSYGYGVDSYSQIQEKQTFGRQLLFGPFLPCANPNFGGGDSAPTFTYSPHRWSF